VAVHVGSGEKDRVRNGPNIGLKRTRSDTETVVPADKKNNRENQRIKEYYQKMLRSDPHNPLLLRNYGKFLHEVCVVMSKDQAYSNYLVSLEIKDCVYFQVEGDVKGAMECYERAIVAGGSADENGDVMALYGKLIWETEKEKDRAEAYLERAVQASPNDWYVCTYIYIYIYLYISYFDLTFNI
jgi:Tfp pilus assembly protein PilF